MTMNSQSKVSNPCGIRVGNLDSVPGRFKCPSCKLLMRDPVQAECGHRYCKSGITVVSGKFPCIACQEEGEDPVPWIAPDSVVTDAAMSRELNSTEFDCPWGPECSVRLRLPELLTHADTECEHRQAACDLCGHSLTASSLGQHRQAECPNRPMPCGKCQEFVPGDRMQSHLDSECVGCTRQCESCPARVRDTDEARLSHARTECPVSWLDGAPCPFGCGEALADARAHREECVAKHLDLERILLLGLRTVLAGTKQQVAEVSEGGVIALETAAASEQPTEYDNALAESEAVILTGELVYKLHQFGLPHLPSHQGSRDSAADREAFYSRLHFAFNAHKELDKEQRSIEQKLRVAYRTVDPLVEQKQREYEELTKASDMYSELLRAMALKEVRIADLDRSISLQELGSTDGVLVWKIAFFKERLADTEYEPVVYSPILFTDKFGYKLSAVAYLNGHNAGRGSHLSLFCRLCQGPYDAAQRWPFRRLVTFSLLDQSSGSHLVREFRPDQSSQFQRPGQPTGQLFGFDKFAPKEDLETKGFLKDDVLFVRIQVSKPTLQSGDF